MTYTVKQGESIADVAMNSTGSILNWDLICIENELTSWTQALTAGQVLVIPSTVVTQQNVLSDLSVFPICNNTVADIDTQITTLENLL
jgi:hypothetical protein